MVEKCRKIEITHNEAYLMKDAIKEQISFKEDDIADLQNELLILRVLEKKIEAAL